MLSQKFEKIQKLRMLSQVSLEQHIQQQTWIQNTLQTLKSEIEVSANYPNLK